MNKDKEPRNKGTVGGILMMQESHPANLCHQLPLVTCPKLAHYKKYAMGAIYENIC